jgi:hypothetical protein
MEISNPDISYGRFNLDYGQGFYVTRLQAQADKWAHRRAKASKKEPYVSVYEFSINDLDILTLDGYTEKWLEFVVKNRTGTAKTDKYDAIYGNIADDDVATIVNDYIRLLKRGRISQTGKMFYLEQLQYSEPNNQYCIATTRGINALEFVKSYCL